MAKSKSIALLNFVPVVVNLININVTANIPLNRAEDSGQFIDCLQRLLVPCNYISFILRFAILLLE